MTIVPTIGVFALQGDVREHVRALEAVGARAVTVRRPRELEAVDGLVVPGGRVHHDVEARRDLRAARTRSGCGSRRAMPAYGSCAGMIMLADRIEGGVEGQQTIGGIDMVVRRNAFGRQVDSFEADIDFAGRGGMRAVFIRAPWVESVGSEVEVLALAEPGIGSSRSAKDRCSPRPSTRNLPGMSVCIHISLRW
ncbi:pyridoxal 5'-phosphate synthase glutaminase subunit PdxT [Streptosporangium vulgare]|uniref:pyridoxal 5'-phosphate synthase glutaminase subunit PdxT n=1 Tax=Streptosporangium vulgare TaxID=46190 RepID=UPI0031D8B091